MAKQKNKYDKKNLELLVIMRIIESNESERAYEK